LLSISIICLSIKNTIIITQRFSSTKLFFVRDAQVIKCLISSPLHSTCSIPFLHYVDCSLPHNRFSVEYLSFGSISCRHRRSSKRSECNLTLLFSNIQINRFLMLYLMSKKQSKEFNDNNSNSNSNNSNELRSLELSTNVNDYDTGESLDCDNIADTTNMEKKTPRRS
jgi:hypothetical protein